MEFIDHTGHVFSLPTYDDKPVAIQYTESDYIFWIKDNPVSINNYYILPIRFLLDYDEYITKLLEFKDNDEISDDDIFSLEISLNSNFYKLIGPKYIQTKLEANKDINEPIEFNLNDFSSLLTLKDFYFKLEEGSDQNIIVYNNNKKFLMFPFYVIGKSDEEGTYLSNISIHIKTYKEESGEKEVVWLDQDQMYDYLMKKTYNNINIYEVDPNTNEKTLWYTLEHGYDPLKNEIITVHQTEYKYRIRNWGYGNINPDVYHYIYRLPEDKWLQPGHHYMFSGYVKQSCHYCGSLLLYNHDGYMDDNEYNYYQSWVPTKNCLLNLDGTPFYPEAYDYDSAVGIYRPKTNQLFKYGSIPSSIEESHNYGEGFHFTDVIFTPDTTIRDFFFDVDNKDVTENQNGGYIEYTYFDEINRYTQITVGCTFIDECEELIINGKNMGINLPKEILKAIYSSSFYNKYADEKLIKTKMKELLLNYMSIKGECGNFKSVINSLKWFGWADKIEISKLIKTDNEFQNQYILDYFTITTDLKETYKYFNTTNLISLSVKGNQETGEYDQQDFERALIGEGKPLLEDLFDKTIEVTYDDLKFYKPYYDFLFNELALKLDCLVYYYQKYFLPIHLKINRASIEYKVYANDMKLSCAAFEKIIEKPVIVHIENDSEKILNVVFPDSSKVLFNKSIHYIDNKFNEFSNYNNSFNDEDLYYVNENCIVIPIKIEDLNNQYSKNNNGDYFLINDEYIKPFKLFKINAIDNYLEEVDDIKKAEYYQLYYNSDYTKFDDNLERYSKVTTEYYNCKIFLSYIDNETNEEKFLVKNNTFNFYQNIDQYYCNYVIIPRLISDKSFDWLNTYFRLSIVINNQWFNYDFTVHTPNIYLDLGKLNYRYYIGDNKTMFNQIKQITTGTRIVNGNTIDDIHFNSFLYQPDLVSIDTLFYNNDNNQILTFLQKLIETDGDQNLIYDFYKKYYQNSINIPYNKKYYNKIHIFDLCKQVEVEDVVYSDLPINWNIDGEDNVEYTDEEWAQLDKVQEFMEQNPEAVFANGFPNLSKLTNITSTLEESMIYDVNFELIGNGGQLITNTRQPWDATEDSTGGITDHGTFEDGIRAFATWFLVDFYPDPLGMYFGGNEFTYIYHLYEFKIYDDNHNLVYHMKMRRSNEDLKMYVNEQLQYRMWNKTHPNQTSSNPYKNWQLSSILEPYKILHYYDAIQYTNAISSIQKVKYNHQDYDSPLTYDEVSYYKMLFNNDGSQKFQLNEDIEYDIYLMHDNVLKENKYWYAVFISKYPIINYTDEELSIHKEEYIIDNITGLMLKYSGYSFDKFLVNRMDVIKSNGYNHFNKDDLIIATINNNNYQFNIDLTSKWIINHVSDANNLMEVESNANMIIISNNNIDNLYKPGYYNITLNYTINGLNDQLYTINGKYLVNNEIYNISYPNIKIVTEEPRKISIDTIISDFSILYENSQNQRKFTPDILPKESGWTPIGIKIVNAGYFAPDSPDIYMGLKLMCCGDPDNGFSGTGSRIYYEDENGVLTYDINPYWGFYNIDLINLEYFSKICYTDESKTQTTNYIYPQTDDPTKVPVNEDGTFKYPAPNNRGFTNLPTSANTFIVNLLNDDDTINKNMFDETCAVSDWDGKSNTNKIIQQFDLDFQPNWRTDSTINNVFDRRFSPAAACCWRYHTKSTKQGDWYLPAFAEVFFVTYNFKKYSEIFEQLSELYPEHCKLDLISCIGSSALWSSTSESSDEAWEIHPCAHAHSLSKRTQGWYTIPFIHINSENNNNNNESYQCLSFIALENCVFGFDKPGLQYSLDEGNTWQELNETTPEITQGSIVMFKGELRQEPSYMTSEHSGIGTFSSTGLFDVSGNILSLIYGDHIYLSLNSSTQIDLSYMFCRLFKNCEYLKNAIDLELILDPVPVLCYSEMFRGCTSLITAPHLPAMGLSQMCYNEMFEDCTNLTTAPELPAIILAPQCYYGMFKGCALLKNIPDLLAPVLTDNCYQYMFWDCKALEKMPLLPATSLAKNCYYGMFTYCQALTTITELPATTLTEGCYGEMFAGCTSLVKAPELPAEHVVEKCYMKMFEGCTSLNYIKAMLLDSFVLDDNNYTTDWVVNVASRGTFVKNSNATWTNKFDLYAIPTGWTVITENEDNI